MGMAAAFLFMEDDGAGLLFKPKLVFDGGNRRFKFPRRHPLLRRRIEAKGKKKLFGPCSPAYSCNLLKCAMEVVC